MKYLAILKDSLREAIDNKVIYVMIGLSVLVTLFALTMSFTPQPARKMMETAVSGQLNWLRMFDRAKQLRGPRQQRAEDIMPKDAGRYRVAGVETVRGPEDSPDSSYRVTVALAQAGPGEAERIRKDPEGEIGRLRDILAAAVDYDFFKVKELRLAPPDNRFAKGGGAYFEFTTEPTPDSRRLWYHQFSLFFGALPLGGGAPLGFVLFISVQTVLWIGSWVTLLVSVIITAFFIPNMLRKGTVDLLLVKPVHRWTLLLYKYVGGLTFILINTAVAILGIWLALGLRSGIWANSFLLMIFVYTAFFAILYAVSTLFAVLTRSSIVAILVTIGFWFVLFIVGLLHSVYLQQKEQEVARRVPEADRATNNAFWTVVRGVHYVTPRTKDLDTLGQSALLHDFVTPGLADAMQGLEKQEVAWGETLTVSGAFIALMLGLSCWRFATKDY